MFNGFNNFKKKPMNNIQNSDDCKIKIRKTADGGSTITFQGKCSREQIQMAKLNFESGDDSDLEDE